MSPEDTKKNKDIADGTGEESTPDPEIVAQVKSRIEHMFVSHAKDPLMLKIRDIAIKFAEEGKISG